MMGILRILPGAASVKSHRKLVLRRAPARSLLEDIVAGQLQQVEGFDTVLHEGRSWPCLAYRAKPDRSDASSPPNALANLLWLHAQIRRQGFSGTRENAPCTLTGPVVMLYGDEDFMTALSVDILALGARVQ